MFSRLLLSSFFFLLFSAFFVNGSSTRPRPLKRLAHPSSVSLKILPRTPNVDRKLTARDLNPQDLKYTDSLRLSLNAFADTFHLHLEPNHDLIHPAAKVEYYKPAPNGKGTVLDRVEPLQRETILVYGGKVIHNDHTEAALAEGLAGGVWRPNGVKAPGERGWARIMVHDAGDPLTGRPPIFEGAFSVDGVIHHVNTKTNYQRTKLDLDPDMEDEDLGDLVVFRDSDLFTVDEEEYIRTGRPVTPGAKKKPPTSCAHDRLGYNIDRNNPVLRYGAGLDRPSESSWLDPLGLVSPNERPGETINGTLVRRQGDLSGNNLNGNFVDSIGNTAGCPITQQIVYMGVVSDCSYTQQNGGGRNATQQILSNWNTVSLLYKSTFNVSLGIVTLQIEDGACPAQVDPNKAWNVPCGAVSLNERLSLFSAFRGARFDAGTDGNDVTGLWHLMSGCPSGTEVGVAWLGTVCMQQASGSAPSIVSGTGVSTGGRTEWQVIAHEIGHNFGAIHDCADGCSLSDDCCPLNANTCNSNAGFLMSPVSSASEQVFSPCTIGNICSLMLGNNIDMTCIQPPNPNQETFSLQMCGNGIVEGEEQCDPGVGAESACCDPATCRFRDNAVCDPLSSPCCSDTCQFAPATQVCRPSRDGQCDVEERCTGTSAACPADTTSPNGQSCGNNGLACANGICTSPSQQCRAVGSSLGLRDACPQSQQNCQISCQDPRNPQQCIVLNSQLVDGSPCGFGGTCVSGDCQSGSIIETAIAWYRQNLQIAIPVSVVVGIIILLILYAIIKAVFRCCCGGKKKKKPPPSTTEVIPSNVPANRIPSWPAPSRGSQTDLRPEPITHGRSGSGSYRPSPSPGRSVSPIPPARSLSPIPPVRAVSPISPVSNYTRSTSPAPPGRQYDSGPAPPPSLRPGNGFAPPPGAPSYPLPPSYGAEASRQSTWGGSAANAYSGGGRSLTDRQDNWVDDSIYNGRR